MKYTVHYSKWAQKDISKLSPPIRKRLKAKLEFFYGQRDPLAFAERLTRPSIGMYRWRIGVYRVLFDFEKDKIMILRVQHRREVYKR